MKKLALKIDVDTWRGTRDGVPRLMHMLQQHHAKATFLFSLGPDHTGRAIKRVFRPGFLSKVSRTSVVEHYGIRTLLYGTVLPGPDIGKREAELMREVRAQGFEVGIHTWDHIKWQDYVAGKDAAWTRAEMRKAAERFERIFGEPARTHGAAGWQINDAALAYERELGMLYASDGRGSHPFQPVDAAGQPLGVPQLPTTLPTLDELIGLDGLTADNVHKHILELTEDEPATGHVYTLHAELEGLRLGYTFEHLLVGWKAQGYQLCSCIELFSSLDAASLPNGRVVMGEIPGRSGTLALQA
ncbi:MULTISPECIES: 4-deoxy-4-formamido-L-arabinose-phosphoundecaprenol deformylase [Chromobacterium]|uniref:4-deoxy-4-formamido-L-arabinose-phosphoundecaprenol deformylase n=1 Tax=Chromobacterium aquaticum TaxID=467180 RepID=A0ABV8ZM69_9NEIS|nr:MULTISPECIES: 4-deoxy-4-formamido-L-arabinose-phosphoundecaprenol deformylase [Chromobacterium]KMN35678.1 chitin deacetylase [Chromobacterium sp. LK1]MCD5360286.1 4-deoxy-4-formamido-L-arabinose-phosphoundecaprenol deformylase [Chromobacterium aquaticum]